MKTPLVVLSTIAVLLALARDSSAATLHVPADFPTIHQALDAAISGDEVVVAPGVYSTTIERTFTFLTPPEIVTLRAVGFLKSGVTLRSESGPEATQIRILEGGAGFNGLVMAQPEEDSPTVVEGFTFHAPHSFGAAILARELLPDGTLHVRSCIFEHLDGGLQEAGGIFAHVGGSVIVSTCRFNDVRSAGPYGAVGTGIPSIAAAPVFLLQVHGSQFEECEGAAIHSRATMTRALETEFLDCAAGVSAEVDLLLLSQDCVYSHCEIGISASSMSLAPTPTGFARVVDCKFLGGDAAMDFRIADTEIQGCRFEGDGAITFGNGGEDRVVLRGNVFREVHVDSFALVYGDDLTGEIAQNTFVGCSNTISFGTPALLYTVVRSGQLRIHHNIFAGTLDGFVITAFESSEGTLVEECNCYWENAGGDTFGFDMSPTSFEADPLFCDPSLMEVTIRSDSPCAPPGPTGCGLVGAGAVACGPTALDSSSWGSIKALYR